MFSTLQAKLLVGVYIFIVLSIPLGAYLVSQRQTIKTRAEQPKKIREATPSATISPVKQLQSLAEQKTTLTTSPSPTPQPTTTTATSFGPTLSLKVILEGRPKDNQAGKLFVGILEGNLTTNPKFLLSFTVDLPAKGEFSNLSLAGLNPGSRYTSLLKGSSSIATSSAFLMSPTVTNLNDGQALTMLSGDLNEDNTVNSADYSIAKAALGSSKGAKNFNDNADFNKDGLVNTLDLSYIIKNLGKIGASGAWTSPLPKTATPSGALTPNATNPAYLPVGSGPEGSQGYWIWVPGF